MFLSTGLMMMFLLCFSRLMLFSSVLVRLDCGCCCLYICFVSFIIFVFIVSFIFISCISFRCSSSCFSCGM